MTVDERRAEIAARLEQVQQRIAHAAVAAGRDPPDVTLIVVTKTFPATDVRLLHELGVRDVGENRHPDAQRKRDELADLDLAWHFIGQVQSNKAAAIASYADVVQSVDSGRLAARLGAGARRAGRELPVLVQVDLDAGDAAKGRGGVLPEAASELASTVAGTDGLQLRGVMAVAPLGEPAGPAFGRLAEIWRSLRAAHPSADVLSAGMSGDFPEAITAGATHVRVGSAVLGSRPLLR